MAKCSLIVLKTKNLENALKFYSALGLEFTLEKHGKGPEHYAATLDYGLVLELYPSQEPDVYLEFQGVNSQELRIDPDGRKIWTSL